MQQLLEAINHIFFSLSFDFCFIVFADKNPGKKKKVFQVNLKSQKHNLKRITKTLLFKISF